MVVVNLAGQPRFLVGAIESLTIGLAIDKVVLTERKVAISFSRLFLW